MRTTGALRDPHPRVDALEKAEVGAQMGAMTRTVIVFDYDCNG